MKNLRRVFHFLSGPKMLHFVMPFVMLYLLIGTVAQKYIGLYEATQLYFSSPVLWWHGIPLPGFPVLLALIFINLMCKLLFKSPWSVCKAGIIITHMGVILLLLGGLFTALYSTEGFVDLAQGEKKSFVTDYHIRELVLLDADGRQIDGQDHKALSVGDDVRFPALLVSFEVLETCRHCEIVERRFVQETHQGMAKHMQLNPAPLRQEDEENIAGLTFALTDETGDKTIHTVIEGVPNGPEITANGETYHIMLRRQRRDLPFQVSLLDFKRNHYPGTSLAESYESRVRIIDGSSQWESLISMNEPLRYKGYTLYQTSFIETPDGDISVLAVVWNAGRSFPYIAGVVICLGLILHLYTRRKKPQRKAEHA